MLDALVDAKNTQEKSEHTDMPSSPMPARVSTRPTMFNANNYVMKM